MQMKTKALLACSVTIFLFLGVVGIASAAPPVPPPGEEGEPYKCGPCDCACGEMIDVNTPPFCTGVGRQSNLVHWWIQNFGSARGAAACRASCMKDALKGNR